MLLFFSLFFFFFFFCLVFFLLLLRVLLLVLVVVLLLLLVLIHFLIVILAPPSPPLLLPLPPPPPILLPLSPPLLLRLVLLPRCAFTFFDECCRFLHLLVDTIKLQLSSGCPHPLSLLLLKGASPHPLDRLSGLVVKASASGAEDPWFKSRLRWDFPGSSHTGDSKIGTPVATLPGAWCYRVSAGTGRPGSSIL